MSFTKADLKQFQSESLDQKMQRSFAKIGEWYSYWNNQVYVSFSGGKDSTVLADLCARWCTIINQPLYLLFVDTGLEYSEIRQHVKFFAEWLRKKYGIGVHLDIIRPKMRFDEVIKKYGYPIIGKCQANTISLSRKNLENGAYSLRLARLGISIAEAKEMGLQTPSQDILDRYEKATKNSKFNIEKYRAILNCDFMVSEQCCNVMKKSPVKEYQKKTGRKPIIATMATESMLRKNNWLHNGCNAFYSNNPQSAPMSFWTEQDVLKYIKEKEIPISSVYGDIEYIDVPEQIRLEDYGIDCGGNEMLRTTGCNRTGCIFCAFGCHLEKEPSRFQRLKETHPRQYEYCMGGGEYDENGIWKPNKKGLGMKHVFDELNAIYGKDFIKYE